MWGWWLVLLVLAQDQESSMTQRWWVGCSCPSRTGTRHFLAVGVSHTGIIHFSFMRARAHDLRWYIRTLATTSSIKVFHVLGATKYSSQVSYLGDAALLYDVVCATRAGCRVTLFSYFTVLHMRRSFPSFKNINVQKLNVNGYGIIMTSALKQGIYLQCW